MPGCPKRRERERRERRMWASAEGTPKASAPAEAAPASPSVKMVSMGGLAGFSARQWDAVDAIEQEGARYVLYGGAMGGGKSYLLRWYCVRRLLWLAARGLTQVPVMLASEDYPTLRDRQIAKVASEFPPWLGRLYSDHRAFGSAYVLADRYGGGGVCFRNLDDPAKYACYHPSTDVLIRGRGFVPIRTVLVGDEVLSLDPSTRNMAWEGVSQVHEYDYSGDMLEHFGRFGAAFSVTPNHRMLYSTRRRRQEIRVCRADELPSTIIVPRVGAWAGQRYLPNVLEFASDGHNGRTVRFAVGDYLEFLGLYLAEGSCDTSRWGISISQHHGRNHANISGLLTAMGVRWTYDGTRYSFNNKALVGHLKSMGGNARSKTIPWPYLDEPPELLARLWSGLMLGDGSAPRPGKFIYTTSSTALASQVSELGLKLGYVPTLYTYTSRAKVYPNGKTYRQREYYHITLTQRGVDCRISLPNRIPYDGKVYCVSAPPHANLLIRYRGRTMFCGNSAEFPLICVDELTKNPPDVFDALRNRLRWPGLPDLDCVFLAGSNPGGVGHGWVKSLWLDGLYAPEWAGHESEFAFIKSLASDNPHVDKGYTEMLGTLPEAQRRAYRDGNWDVYIGQAFPEFSTATHVVDGGPVPAGVAVIMSYDWGFGKPYSVMWWWVDGDGRLWGCGELYGAVPGGRDIGLRQSDTEVAACVLREEQRLGVAGRGGLRLCDPTSFNRQADPQGGGQRPSTAETWARSGLILTPGDPSRRQKLRQMHERLRRPRDGSLPMLVVYPRCRDFIRTLPVIPVDRNDPEEVDTKSEDHGMDACALVCQSRPLLVSGMVGGVGVAGVGSGVCVGGSGLAELGSV